MPCGSWSDHGDWCLTAYERAVTKTAVFVVAPAIRAAICVEPAGKDEFRTHRDELWCVWDRFRHVLRRESRVAAPTVRDSINRYSARSLVAGCKHGKLDSVRGGDRNGIPLKFCPLTISELAGVVATPADHCTVV